MTQDFFNKSNQNSVRPSLQAEIHFETEVLAKLKLNKMKFSVYSSLVSYYLLHAHI